MYKIWTANLLRWTPPVTKNRECKKLGAEKNNDKWNFQKQYTEQRKPCWEEKVWEEHLTIHYWWATARHCNHMFFPYPAFFFFFFFFSFFLVGKGCLCFKLRMVPSLKWRWCKLNGILHVRLVVACRAWEPLLQSDSKPRDKYLNT